MNRDFFGKARAKKAALRYSHPSRTVRLILVVGEYGASTTALYLGELLRENGDGVAVFTDRRSHINGEAYPERYDASAEAVQRAISKSRKSAETVIMAVTPAFERSCVLDSLQIEMTVITSECDLCRIVMQAPAAYMVVPEGMSTDGTAIAPHQKISFGESELAEAYLRNSVLYKGGTEVEITIDHQTNLTLSTYLLGRANAYNVAAAVAAGYLLGLDIAKFEEGIARLEGVRGNLEKLSLAQPYHVYVDGAPTARSADLVSASMKQLTKRRLLIACDDTFSDETLDMFAARADRVTVAKGEEIHGRYHADDLKQAVELTLRSAKKDDIVLLIGPHFCTETEAGKIQAETIIEEVIRA